GGGTEVAVKFGWGRAGSQTRVGATRGFGTEGSARMAVGFPSSARLRPAVSALPIDPEIPDRIARCPMPTCNQPKRPPPPALLACPPEEWLPKCPPECPAARPPPECPPPECPP